MFLNIKNEIYSKITAWIIYIFIAIFPFITYQGFLYFGTATRSVNLIITTELLVAVFICFLFKKESSVSIMKSPISIVLVSYLVILFVCGIVGVDFSASFWSKATKMEGIFYFIHLFVFYLFLFQFFNGKERIKNFLRVFLISAGIFSIFSLLGNDGFGLIFKDMPWSGFTFGNSTFAAMYLYFAFMMSIYYVISSDDIKHHWWKFITPVVFIISPYFVNSNFWLGKENIIQNPLRFFGGSQSSAYTLFLSVIILFIIWFIAKIKSDRIKKNILWLSVFIGIVLAGSASYSLLSTGGYLQKVYLNLSGTARPIVWNLSEKAIKDHPVLGWGLDNFEIAFQTYYDNSLLESKNGGEAWFDRAHNVFMDKMVETGLLGLIIYLLIYIVAIGCLIYVLFKAREKNNKQLSAVLVVYLLGHIIELQTAFDTSISYVPFIIVLAISAVIFQQTLKEDKKDSYGWLLSGKAKNIFGGVAVLVFLLLFFIGTAPITTSEITNGNIRTVGSSDSRLPMYDNLFNTPVDKGTFVWRSSYDLQRGISLSPEILGDIKKNQGFIKEFDLLIKEYDSYLKNSNNYRQKIQFAETCIYERLLGVDKLSKAQDILDKAILINSNAPQAYWMKAVAFLYQHNFPQAKSFANKALNLNPGIEESQRLADYIDKSIKSFPEIDFYSFKQI